MSGNDKHEGVNIHPLVAGRETPFSLVCHVCHDRGFYPSAANRRVMEPCNCRAGEAVRGIAAARAALAAVYAPRDAELWLQSRSPAFAGERPLTLLRDGRAAEVLAAIKRLSPS